MDFEHIQRVYFVGIGGIGMSALARYFVLHGKAVAGYDKTSSGITADLEGMGVAVHHSDDVNLIPADYRTVKDDTLVIYTPAIPANHSELNFFINNGYSITKRAQVLGLIASAMRTLAVAGTHGKTSTTAMLSYILGNSSIGCEAFLGGISKNFGSNLVSAGKGKNILVVEADEYDRSFLNLSPHLAVVTSVDADHLDIYGTHGHVQEAFNLFAGQVKPNGTLVKKFGISFNPNLASGVKTLTYGFAGNADVYPSSINMGNGYCRFTLNTPNGVIENLRLGVPGRYNLENALAASAAALAMGISTNELHSGLQGFSGVVRRFDVRFNNGKSLYIDDYAHHPQEINAMVGSVRDVFPNRKVVGIFQPHLYSRTRDFADEFARALDKLDSVILLDIYPARELPIEGVTSNLILRGMENPSRILLSKDDVLEWIRGNDIDILLTMGAGDIDRMVPKIVEVLSSK